MRIVKPCFAATEENCLKAAFSLDISCRFFYHYKVMSLQGLTSPFYKER
ncbi:hypothetical protein FAEPRAM212_00563 [Faecalibacterium prausnitzii M21/2]|uniref:Uncharacterized protein n=1 Tax=Faecalibacterium prausnitzii M21/2 TaxID=411485 RepID=A8S7U6_9FIRM|nr:hypothetical protein FAEPRAM212_00563 [Faecalibacterium prausnitzii M21/2]